MQNQETHKRLIAQDGEGRRRMLKATGIASHKLNDFMTNPNKHPLDEIELEKIGHWFKGDYMAVATSDGYILKPRKKPQTVALAAKPPLHAGKRVDYGDPARGKLAQALGAQPTKRGDAQTAAGRRKLGLGGIGNLNVPGGHKRSEHIPDGKRQAAPSKNATPVQQLMGLGWRKQDA